MNQRQVEAIAKITKALMKLSAARREKLDKVDFETFVEGLGEFDPAIVEQVCGDFSRIAPEEYQPRFPPLHALRQACYRATEMVESRRMALKAAKVEKPAPLTEAQRDHLRSLFQRSMPGHAIPAFLKPSAVSAERGRP